MKLPKEKRLAFREPFFFATGIFDAQRLDHRSTRVGNSRHEVRGYRERPKIAKVGVTTAVGHATVGSACYLKNSGILIFTTPPFNNAF